MGASKKSFSEHRELENIISRIKHNKGSEFQQQYNVAKLANMINPEYIGDLKMFRLLIQCNLSPEDAFKFTHGPMSKECREQLLKPAKEPKCEFGDYWDEWMNSPERFDEERENRLL